jgi:hypothetical protein
MAAEHLHGFLGPIAFEKNKTEIVQRCSIIRPYRQDFAKTSGRILAAPQVAQEKAAVEHNIGIARFKRRGPIKRVQRFGVAPLLKPYNSDQVIGVELV